MMRISKFLEEWRQGVLNIFIIGLLLLTAAWMAGLVVFVLLAVLEAFLSPLEDSFIVFAFLAAMVLIAPYIFSKMEIRF